MININEELKSYGPTGDGSDYVAPVFFIVATLEDGSRFRYNITFPTTTYQEDEDGFPYYPNHYNEALAEATELLKDLRRYYSNWKATNSVALNPELWHHTEPVYGSEAYQNK